MSEPDPLRARLLALRTRALSAIGDDGGIDAGMLRLVADATTVLAIADAGLDGVPMADRVVITDDGHRIMLAIYNADRREPVAVVELEPRRALRLASNLLLAGLRRNRDFPGDFRECSACPTILPIMETAEGR